jgi:predicted ATPase
MHISKFKLHHYKSYLASSEIDLAAGFNIVVGQNNVGKTALLEALRLNFAGNAKPHRSLQTAVTADSVLEPNSWADVSVLISRDELSDIHRNHLRRFGIPIPISDEGLPFDRSKGIHDPDYHRSLSDWVFSHETLTIRFRVNSKGWSILGNTSFGLYEAPTGKGVTRHYTIHVVKPDGTISITGPGNDAEEQSDFGFQLIPYFRNRIYSFKAERVVGRCRAGLSEDLLPNAENLAEVLDNLQKNHFKFQRFTKLVQIVLPQIKHISVQSPDVETREVVIWPADPETERIDLAIPLSDSGTGVSQVLAILFVVFTSPFSRTILIDEPQSFLHPGAVRKLIELFKMDYPQHQYIMATHSPTVITAANPANIILVRQSNSASDLQRIDPTKTEELRGVLAELGARLSDVFGADNILWVEGQTEEICFPMIIQKILGRRLMGTIVVGVRNTGDLEGKHARRIYEIYEKLSRASALVPPALGFIFDREGRSDKERADLDRMSGGLVAFLPRRLYENFLLNPYAIAAVMNETRGFRETPIQVEEIQAWFDNEGKSEKYIKSPKEATSKETWLIEVHGANLLSDLFSSLSEARVSYVKTEHSVQITEWIIENAPEELEQIAEIIRNKLQSET